mgnify:CR=1 FL=1
MRANLLHAGQGCVSPPIRPHHVADRQAEDSRAARRAETKAQRHGARLMAAHSAAGTL